MGSTGNGRRPPTACATRSWPCRTLPEPVSEAPYERLPPQAREGIGIAPGQKNVLVRLVTRDLVRTLTGAGANALRDAVYAALHEGTAWQWAA